MVLIVVDSNRDFTAEGKYMTKQLIRQQADDRFFTAALSGLLLITPYKVRGYG